MRGKIKNLEEKNKLQSDEVKKHIEENYLLTEKYETVNRWLMFSKKIIIKLTWFLFRYTFCFDQEVNENSTLMNNLEKQIEEAKCDIKSANEVVQELRAENESCNLKFLLYHLQQIIHIFISLLY